MAFQQSGFAFYVPPLGMTGFTEASMLPLLLLLWVGGHVVAQGTPN
jgi:hypothetical protein